MKLKTRFILTVFAFFIFASCANIFNGIVLPKQCKKCEVIDSYTNESVWSTEGCGSANTKLEEDAKIKAYDMNEAVSSFRYQVRCVTWKDTTVNK
jgi:hypothetical protein